MSTRMVYCVGISNKQQKYPDELCNNSSRPISKKECFSEAVCPAMWHASQWSKVRERNTGRVDFDPERTLHTAWVFVIYSIVDDESLSQSENGIRDRTLVDLYYIHVMLLANGHH